MTTDVKRVFVVLACAALLAPAAFARSTARVSVPDLTPFTVHGSGFVSRERVTVVVSAKGLHRTHLVTAGAAGTFTTRFTLVRITSCTSYFVKATGDRGSSASFKVAPECAPPPPPDVVSSPPDVLYPVDPTRKPGL